MATTTNSAGRFSSLNFRELIQYRDLFWVLALRDLKVRYVQTSLGMLWSIMRPLATMLVFMLIFQRVAKVQTPVPYPLFTMIGLSAWTYFSAVMTSAGSSIIASQNMIKKVYFPRLIIPLSKALVSLIDFGITFIFVIGLMIYYGISPTANLWFLPLFILMNIITALAFGIWASALSVRFRDVQQLIPFLVQLGVYITPVAYPSSLITGKLRLAYELNPMASIVEGFRWCLVGGEPIKTTAFLSFGVVIIILITGLYYFRRTERVMADIV